MVEYLKSVGSFAVRSVESVAGWTIYGAETVQSGCRYISKRWISPPPKPTRWPWFVLVGVTSVVVVAVVLIARRKHYFCWGVCRSKVMLDGKTVVITGASTGIGKETAVDLAKRRAKVIIACRSKERGEETVAEISEASHSQNVEYRHLNLASLKSVRQFTDGILNEDTQVDILINHVSIGSCSRHRAYEKTEDGFEMLFGVNHLGHFLLTNLLLERMKESQNARIINVSSKAYLHATEGIKFDALDSEQNHEPYMLYSWSKLANVLFTNALARKVKQLQLQVTVNCLDPGFTEWSQFEEYYSQKFDGPISHIFGKILKTKPVTLLLRYVCVKTPKQGAQTTIHCAVSNDLKDVSGRFFADCRELPLVAAAARDHNAAEKLWDVSEKMVNEKF